MSPVEKKFDAGAEKFVERLVEVLSDPDMEVISCGQGLYLDGDEYRVTVRKRMSPKVRRKCRIVALKQRIAKEQRELDALEAEDRADP